MNKLQRCFVCKKSFQQSHYFYSGLCCDCGEVNYAKRNETANLHGMFALVTGARVKIGYAVTLRLLRAGASVIVTTRFARDAAKRYAGEADFGDRGDRLHVYELDLRYIAKVERFAEHLTSCYPRLDIIRPLAKILLIKFWDGLACPSHKKKKFVGWAREPVLIIFARGLLSTMRLKPFVALRHFTSI